MWRFFLPLLSSLLAQGAEFRPEYSCQNTVSAEAIESQRREAVLSDVLATRRAGDQVTMGGFGRVFFGVDVFGNEVAVKMPRVRLMFEDKDSIRSAFQREAEVVGLIRANGHPGGQFLLPVVFLNHPSNPTLVTPYQKQNLESMLERGEEFSSVRVLQILRELILAVGAIQKSGLVHGDIKPGNIFFSETGQLLLSDFGLVRKHGEPSSSRYGTEGFVPLEQWGPDGGWVCGSRDVFAALTTLGHLLSREAEAEPQAERLRIALWSLANARAAFLRVSQLQPFLERLGALESADDLDRFYDAYFDHLLAMNLEHRLGIEPMTRIIFSDREASARLLNGTATLPPFVDGIILARAEKIRAESETGRFTRGQETEWSLTSSATLDRGRLLEASHRLKEVATSRSSSAGK